MTFSQDLIHRLRDPEEAENLLDVALEDGDPQALLQVLKYIVAAQGGMSAISKKARLTRATLYQALDKNGNPTYRSLNSILDALGFKLKVERQRQPRRRASLKSTFAHA
jgi:probable addiction module antidote protein